MRAEQRSSARPDHRHRLHLRHPAAAGDGHRAASNPPGRQDVIGRARNTFAGLGRAARRRRGASGGAAEDAAFRFARASVASSRPPRRRRVRRRRRAPDRPITYTPPRGDGSGDLANLRVADAVPAGTTYQSGSLTLEGGALTDAADADAGSFTGTGINVALGTVAAGTTKTITFQVKID